MQSMQMPKYDVPELSEMMDELVSLEEKPQTSKTKAIKKTTIIFIFTFLGLNIFT